MITIADNYKRILEKIDNAALRTKRNPADVMLVAVSKTFPFEKVLEAIEAGARIFGENYIQEAVDKIEAVRGMSGVIEWHFIGHLQTNKVKYASGKFSMIESVDSIKLLNEINKKALSAGITEKVLFEVNVSGEESKFGFSPEALETSLEEISGCRNVIPMGLMTMPPYSSNQEDSRRYFVRLHELMEQINAKKIPGINFQHLSMGMSGDFEVAIEEGATIIRVGTAIFGGR